MVGLSKALRVFEDEGLNLVHIESRKVKGSKDKVAHSSLQYSHLHVRRSCTWRSTVRRARTGTRSSMSSTPCAGSTSAPLTRLHKIYHQTLLVKNPFDWLDYWKQCPWTSLQLKSWRFQPGVPWVSILVTVSPFQKQLLTWTPAKRCWHSKKSKLLLFSRFSSMELIWMLTTLDSKIQSTGGRVSSENLVLTQEEKRLLRRPCYDLSSWTTVTSCQG